MKEREDGEEYWGEGCEEELEGRAGSFKRNMVDIGRARRVNRERYDWESAWRQVTGIREDWDRGKGKGGGDGYWEWALLFGPFMANRIKFDRRFVWQKPKN